MKRLILALSISIMIASRLAAASASAIYFASDEELRRMCAVRGLEAGTREGMQQALYGYEGLEAYSEDGISGSDGGEDGYVLTIEGAENLVRDGDRAVLSGGASISFDDDGTEAFLSADTIIIDSANRRLTALENVVYRNDSEDASIQDIDADIVTLAWETGTLVVTNATTSSARGSEDEDAITFYTSGETLTYSPGGGMLYEDGFITSNPEDAYSSITASEIAMLPGSDMFVTNAYLSIGRVPLFWVPFFFFPGTNIAGNPTIGFTSSAGAFINTTFELLGRADSVSGAGASSEGSFMSLLQTGEDEGNMQPVGSYYTASEPLSAAEQWARSSGSYIALMADAYSSTGLHMGLDSHLSFLSNTLSFTFYDGIAVSPASPSNYFDGNLRFYGMNEVDYSDKGLDINLSLPFYSDSHVMMDFGNRLSGFSLFSLVQTPQFPEDYTSTISTYSHELEFGYTLPSELRNDWISSLTISDLTLSADYRWNSAERKYYIERATVPSFSASITGKIFEFASAAAPVVTASVEKDDITDIHLLRDPLLYDIYKAEERRAEATGDETYRLSLGYTISENMENYYRFGSDGSNTYGSFTTTSSMRLTFEAEASEYAYLRAIFTPSYSYVWNDRKTGTASVSYNHRGSVNSDILLSIPYVGIEYRIATKLMNITSETTDDTTVNTSFIPGWDDETITSHSIAFKKAFVTEAGTFTPSVEYVLPPLAARLTPRLAYSYGPWAVSFGWQFLQETADAPFRTDLVELSIGLDSTYVTSSVSLRYQSSEYTASDILLPLYGEASFSLRTEDKAWSITQYADWEYFEGTYYNYFNSLMTTLKIPTFDLSLEWDGPAEDLSFRSITAHLDVESASFQLWKGRIYFSFGLESSFEMDMQNPYASEFIFRPSITFSIAEFLDFRFSVSSSNSNFYDYVTSGNFFGEMFADLWRSFDFFGDGRSNTSFVMDDMTLEVIHYMEDWDLHCAYSAEVILYDDVYEFVPKFSVFLSWKTIPDLKIDQNWEYNARSHTWGR